jgi:hypothetical protein
MIIPQIDPSISFTNINPLDIRSIRGCHSARTCRITMRAGTAYLGSDLFWLLNGSHRLDRIQNGEDLRVCYPVVNVPTLSAILDDRRLAHDGQMLRDECLPVTQVCLHVADAVFPIPEDVQDGQARRMRQYSEDPGLQFVNRGTVVRFDNHIQFTEYYFNSLVVTPK